MPMPTLPASGPNNWVRALFLGDSLTTGSRDPYGLAWPYYMAHVALADGIGLKPVVEAVNGRRSSDLLRVALAAIEASDAREAFILIGTNDAKDEAPVPTAIVVANIVQISAWCRLAGLRDYLLTIPLPQGFGSPGYTIRTVDRIRETNAALRQLQHPRLVECEDVRDTVDGVHLHEDSSRAIAHRCWAMVKRERTLS
jgi:lysophospholipase L1-like esterase